MRHSLWKLRPGWTAKVLVKELIIQSDTRRLRIRSNILFPTDLPERLRDGITRRDESDLAFGNEISLIDRLIEHEVMTHDSCVHNSIDNTKITSRQTEYFLHIGVLPAEALRRITESRVLILGLGGTGTVVLQHLVGAGLRRFVLVDDDAVEVSNLERQFIYSKNDIGVKKTQAASDYILTRSVSAEIQTYYQRISTRLDLKGILDKAGVIDLCVICIDQPPNKIFEITTELLWNSEVPFIHGGVMIRSGFFGPLFKVQRSLHEPSLFSTSRYDSLAAPVGPLQIAFAPYNTIVGASIAAESLHYLIGAFDFVDFQHRTFLDLSHGKFVKLGPRNEEIRAK